MKIICIIRVINLNLSKFGIMTTLSLDFSQVSSIKDSSVREILSGILFPKRPIMMSYGNYNDYGNYDDQSYPNYNDYGNYDDQGGSYGNYSDYGNYNDFSYGNYNDYSNYNDD